MSSPGGASTSSLTRCRVCETEVPAGAFCGSCGAAQRGKRRRRRFGAYAATPSEHTLRPSLTTSLFPHLPQRSLLAVPGGIRAAVPGAHRVRAAAMAGAVDHRRRAGPADAVPALPARVRGRRRPAEKFASADRRDRDSPRRRLRVRDGRDRRRFLRRVPAHRRLRSADRPELVVGGRRSRSSPRCSCWPRRW